MVRLPRNEIEAYTMEAAKNRYVTKNIASEVDALADLPSISYVRKNASVLAEKIRDMVMGT